MGGGKGIVIEVSRGGKVIYFGKGVLRFFLVLNSLISLKQLFSMKNNRSYVHLIIGIKDIQPTALLHLNVSGMVSSMAIMSSMRRYVLVHLAFKETFFYNIYRPHRPVYRVPCGTWKPGKSRDLYMSRSRNSMVIVPKSEKIWRKQKNLQKTWIKPGMLRYTIF